MPLILTKLSSVRPWIWAPPRLQSRERFPTPPFFLDIEGLLEICAFPDTDSRWVCQVPKSKSENPEKYLGKVTNSSFSRTKLSKDPNNTHWSNETDRFGHKILTGLGWTPGSTLGAKDASHADHYTAASASHIRVLLKDDNLGLGARRGKADEQFGLSIFQNLLGRLNGKSDTELEKEDEKRRDVQLKQFQSQRFGAMHFVSGGFLVGDKIEKLIASTKIGDDAVDNSTSDKALKKRKRDTVAMQEEGLSSVLDTETQSGGILAVETSRPSKKSKKSKKGQEGKIAGEQDLDTMETTAIESITVPSTSDKEERRRLKAERRARKEARRLKREEKEKRRESRKAKKSASDDTETDDTAERGASTAAFSNGRHIVRQRYIQQKRMAYSSEQALKEVRILYEMMLDSMLHTDLLSDFHDQGSRLSVISAFIDNTEPIHG